MDSNQMEGAFQQNSIEDFTQFGSFGRAHFDRLWLREHLGVRCDFLNLGGALNNMEKLL
jgi:hypothetical protein